MTPEETKLETNNPTIKSGTPNSRRKEARRNAKKSKKQPSNTKRNDRNGQSKPKR